jgi:serine/threonine protein kinase/tetratricopeptide (TPR) repeat protein
MPDPDRLEALLLHYDECRSRGLHLSPAELCADQPELLDKLRRCIQELESVDAWLNADDDNASPTTSALGASAVGALADPPAQPVAAAACYRVLSRHAQGGLGEVVLAEDEGLHRRVALKRMRPEAAGVPHSRRRFLREAEITSRLEHPGIVPVHVAGRDTDGRPFYVMRFVQGETLQEAIERFHGAAGADWDKAERRRDFRQLLGRFVTVCNTLAYAHSQGVVHRDVKPSNILLGPYGETLLIDWGLAKACEGTAGPEGIAFATTMAPADTQAGAVLGTPAFMSPEQAEGRGESIGPTSDVYGLGATPYALLTGQVPFAGSQVAEVIEKVRRGDLIPPRRRNAQVPPALEAVCLKAMARLPERRYPSPLELAADLERWLADEPVSAWREPWPTRCRRWVGRHRTLVTAAAAAVGVATCCLAIATGLLVEAKQRTEQANEDLIKANRQAEQANQQAEEDFRTAHQAAWNFYDISGELDSIRGTTAVRQKLRRTALQYFQGFLQRRGQDAGLQVKHAEIQMAVGDILMGHGSKDEALQTLLLAQRTWERLAAAGPDDRRLRRKLVACENAIGAMLFDLCRREEGLRRFVETAARLRQWADEDPADPFPGLELARSYHGLGALQIDPWERLCWWERTRGLQERLLQEHGDRSNDPQLWTDLAQTCNNIGDRLYDLGRDETGRADEALAWFRKAEALYRKVANHHYAAHSLISIGTVQTQTNPAAAHVSLDQARTILEATFENDPQSTLVKEDLTDCYYRLGELRRVCEKPSEAEEWYSKALKGQSELTGTNPDVPRFRRKLAESYAGLGALHAAAGDWQKAEPMQRAELALWEELAQADPAVWQYREGLATAHTHLGMLRTATGRRAEAEEAYRRALAIWEDRLGGAEGRDQTRARIEQALLRARLGEHAAATAAVERAIRNRPGGVILYKAACVHALAATGVATVESARAAEAYAMRAVCLLEQARQTGYLMTGAGRVSLRHDADLTALRGRIDFAQVQRAIEK